MPQSSASLFPDQAAPQEGEWVTAHCDGGARGNPGPAGFGVVVTDARGGLLAELSEFLGKTTNNVAEYRGLLAALEWAVEHGKRRLRVVSDSLLMVQQIKGKFKVNSQDLRPLWEAARQRIAQLEGFEISHALRHKNKDADRLANEAMDRGMGRSVQETAPRGQRAASQHAESTRPEQKMPQGTMLRGFVRDGAVHLLGGAHLPDGVFVKVIPE